MLQDHAGIFNTFNEYPLSHFESGVILTFTDFVPRQKLILRRSLSACE